MRARRAAVIGATLMATLVAAACHDPLDAELTGAVITLVDSTGPELRSALTFALPDTIVELASSVFQLDHDEDQAIVATIRNHLVDIGWRDLTTDTAARPDVVVLTAATTRIQTGVVYSDWYGAWGYLPYWGPAVTDSWTWSVPGDAVVYSFPAGTLVVVMVDLRNQRPELQDIPLLWAAAIDGVIRGASATAERARDGITQAFAQSDYLRREP
jgi:hypothetical protein